MRQPRLWRLGVRPRHVRRGTVVVQTAVMSSMLIGFAALAIDVGHMYNVRAELQRSADAAALGAAQQLSNYAQGDPKDLARATAQELVNRNKVLGEGVTLDLSTDVVFGRAELASGTSKYAFIQGDEYPNAVRVRVRRSADSPSGAIPLFFAHIFGVSQKDMSADATAVLIPRDIAVVADLSGSHTDDSELRACNRTTINLHAVWSALPGGLEEGDPGYSAQTSGPAWGNMNRFGTEQVDCTGSYNPRADDGLFYLPKSQDFRTSDPAHGAELQAYLSSQGYNAAEINALLGGVSDGVSSVNWKNRVAVVLGLAHWKSGIPGGRWSIVGGGGGNSNLTIDNTELVWEVAYPANSGSWLDYIGNYASSSSTAMVTEGDSRFRYTFGPKTFVNYLLERYPSHSSTPDLADTPTQPMQAVKDSVTYMMDRIVSLDSNDQASLEIYGTTAHHEVNLTEDVTQVSDRLNAMQAGHYDSWTNMGGGMQKGIDELQSSRARPSAQKTIVLLTDGVANVTEDGHAGDQYAEAAEQYVRNKVTEAFGLGIRVYVVSVGSECNLSFLSEMAQIGHGEHFHAEGTIEEYSSQLDAILTDLGGRRPVVLID